MIFLMIGCGPNYTVRETSFERMNACVLTESKAETKSPRRSAQDHGIGSERAKKTQSRSTIAVKLS